MERFEDLALVLGNVDYGEADRIVTLLTQAHGKVSAFAAGARKSKRRFAGALEPMTLLKVSLVERHGNTFRLDRAEIERSFHCVREDLSRIARGLYAVELSRELVRESEPQPELFSLLTEYLELLEKKGSGPTSLLVFELSALAFAGLMPRFDRCAVCGRATGEAPCFDPSHGGTLCAPCAFRERTGAPVPAEVVKGLAQLQRGEEISLSMPARRRARELLNAFIGNQLGRKLKSVDFMAQVGMD